MQSLFGLIVSVSSAHRAAHVCAQRGACMTIMRPGGWGLLSRCPLHRSPTLVWDTVNRYFISDPHHLSPAEEKHRRREDDHYLKDYCLKNTTHRWFLPAYSTDGTFQSGLKLPLGQLEQSGTVFTTVKLYKCLLAATTSKVHRLISHLRKAPVTSYKGLTALRIGQRDGQNTHFAFATTELHHQAIDFVLNMSWKRQQTRTHSLTWSVFCWPASWCLPSNPQAQPSFLPKEERDD